MSAGENLESVAWLRLLHGQDGEGVRAGLLKSNSRGEPLSFCFTFGEASADDESAYSLVEILFRSAGASPLLVFGVAREMPEWALKRAVPGVSCCRVLQLAETNGPPSAQDIADRIAWSGNPSSLGSSAERVFKQILQWQHPFEPLERVARGLTVAFSEPRVRDMVELSGLNTVMSLSPPRNLHRGRRISGVTPIESATGKEGGEIHDLDFVNRVWTTLLVPESEWSTQESADPLAWYGDLMPFQRDGVHALTEMKRILLSDDMGLGKTVQAIAAMRILKAQGKVVTSLVVAPASILNQWRQELLRWAPELSAIIVRGSANDRDWQWRAVKDVTLVSYDVLRQDARFLKAMEGAGRKWDLVVLDEAQKIKNRNDTSEAAKNIGRARSWALTGTPIENDEEELASIMEFVDHRQGAPRRHYRPGPELRVRHRELQLRRKKRDVLPDLPEKLQTLIPIHLTRQQRKSYDKAEREGIVYLKSLGSEIGIQHILELITRLKQICNADPKSGASSKLDDIKERLWTLTAQGHRALVFSQYTSDTSGVALAAKHLGAFNPLILTGETPVAKRSEIIEQFKSNEVHKALIISLRAGGLGLNLQEASYVFHLDRWWNPALERQAEDRTHRMGQTVKVNVIKYSCEDTIEQRIDEILRRKQELFNSLVDDVSLDLSIRLNRQELLGLFGLD